MGFVDWLKSCYDAVWLVDTEFRETDGDFPIIRCMVARELFTGTTIRMWADELARCKNPPFDVSNRALFVAYYAPAELKCFLQLGWVMPKRILDLFVEFKSFTNGRRIRHGHGLIGALLHYGLPATLYDEKQAMRELAMEDRTSDSYSPSERQDLIIYCESDVVALDHLIRRMEFDESLFIQSLFRGRYMAAIAAIETTGIPVDVNLIDRVQKSWEFIQDELIKHYDAQYGIFKNRSWSFERFEQYLIGADIPWPQTESGRLATDDNTFSEMARQYPCLAELKALRESLGKMRLFADLPVGPDGRNRTSLSPFRSKTGRNQPSNKRFIFGPSVWTRSFIRPKPGKAIAYLDWSQQEFLIAAALSGDQAMLDAYASGDVYMSVAVLCGRAPKNANKATHPQERALFKQIVLANNYGQGPMGMSQKIGCSVTEAKHLQWLFRNTFSKYFEWTDGVLNTATLSGEYRTPFGWPLHIEDDEVNSRSIKNFPIQGAGSDMLHIACCLTTEAGISACCSVHDALLIESDIEGIQDRVNETTAYMTTASEAVCGVPCRTDAKIFSFPNRFIDEDRGLDFFRVVMEILGERVVLSDLAIQVG